MSGELEEGLASTARRGTPRRSAAEPESGPATGLSRTLPSGWKPSNSEQDLGLPRLRTLEALRTPRGGYISPQRSTSSLPASAARHQKPGRDRVSRQSSLLSTKSCPPSVVDLMKDAAPKTPAYLVGSTKYPKAWIEGGFAITERGFEKAPAGLEPPFYAQSGPSVLHKGVLIKNKVRMPVRRAV